MPPGMTNWADGLPASRDLTNSEETQRVLSLASKILAFGTPLHILKSYYYGNEECGNAGPAILVSAIGSAESKQIISQLPPFHLTCIFAMYGEQNRIRKKIEHVNGQDSLRMKVRQLKWLFAGEEEKTWEIIAVDDGCPNNSRGLAQAIVDKEEYSNVHVLGLEDAVTKSIPFFRDRGLTRGCKESRKGGAILYGLYHAASQLHINGHRQHKSSMNLVMYTDSDLSLDMSLCGLLVSDILGVKKSQVSIGARYGISHIVKSPHGRILGYPQNMFVEYPNMMKINMRIRHYIRSQLFPKLSNIYDIHCHLNVSRPTTSWQSLVTCGH